MRCTAAFAAHRAWNRRASITDPLLDAPEFSQRPIAVEPRIRAQLAQSRRALRERHLEPAEHRVGLAQPGIEFREQKRRRITRLTPRLQVLQIPLQHPVITTLIPRRARPLRVNQRKAFRGRHPARVRIRQRMLCYGTFWATKPRSQSLLMHFATAVRAFGLGAGIAGSAATRRPWLSVKAQPSQAMRARCCKSSSLPFNAPIWHRFRELFGIMIRTGIR